MEAKSIVTALTTGWFVLTLSFAAARAHATSHPNQALPTFVEGNSPPRLGFMTLNSQLDETKPLASFDPAGFVYNSGTLIGAVDERWVVGLSFMSQSDIWWLDGETTMTAPPGSFGSHVVLGFRSGHIKKVEALTGKVIWTTQLDSFTERGFVLVGSKLYVLTASQVLHAIDFQTGQISWLFDAGFPDGLTIRGRTKPLVYDGRVYFGVSSGELISVDSETGKLDWRLNPEFLEGQFHDYVGELVAKDQTLIFARYDGLVGAVSLTGPTRSLAWKDEFPSLSSAVVKGQRIYLGGVNGDVIAKELGSKSAASLWRYSSGVSVSSLTVSEDMVIVAGTTGRITALRAADGSVKWHDDLESSLETPPLLIDRALYFATGLKSFYGYEFIPGRLQH